MKKLLIISSSPRKGNSDALADAFMAGAISSGASAEKIRLSEKKIAYCTGCGTCSQNGTACIMHDDVDEIVEKMKSADVICLVTPVYFYSMSAQLKTFIDRCCAYYTDITDKEFYYIMTAADEEKGAFDKTIEAVRGFTLDCLENAEEKGILTVGGVWLKGEISDDDLERAREMGRNI